MEIFKPTIYELEYVKNNNIEITGFTISGIIQTIHKERFAIDHKKIKDLIEVSFQYIRFQDSRWKNCLDIEIDKFNKFRISVSGSVIYLCKNIDRKSIDTLLFIIGISHSIEANIELNDMKIQLISCKCKNNEINFDYLNIDRFEQINKSENIISCKDRKNSINVFIYNTGLILLYGKNMSKIIEKHNLIKKILENETSSNLEECK